MSQVSVIIPTYDRRDVVCNAVESAMRQDPAPLEVIVCDDASTDDTEALLAAQFGDRLGFRYERLSTNQGGAVARNLGIDAARGRYLAFLDSDDIWKPGKLASCVGAFETAGLGAKDILYHQCELVEGDRIGIEPVSGMNDDELFLDYVLSRDGQIRTPSLFMLSETAREIRFDPSLRLHQDWDFCTRAQTVGCSFHFVPVPLTTVFRGLRGDRISETYDLDASAAWLGAHRDMMNGQAFARRMCAILHTKRRRGESFEPARFARWLMASDYGVKKTLGMMALFLAAR